MAAHDSRLAQSAIFLVPFKLPMGRRHVGDEDPRPSAHGKFQLPTPDPRRPPRGLGGPFPHSPWNSLHLIRTPGLLSYLQSTLWFKTL